MALNLALSRVPVKVITSGPRMGDLEATGVAALFGAQFSRPAMAGMLWMVATTVKWVPAVFWPFISPRGRLWGLAWFLLALVLTAVTLPATLTQLQVLFSFQRPLRVDYLVFIWGIVPWAWRQYAHRGYLLLQELDRRLLEPRLPAAVFYNLMIAAQKPG